MSGLDRWIISFSRLAALKLTTPVTHEQRFSSSTYILSVNSFDIGGQKVNSFN